MTELRSFIDASGNIIYEGDYTTIEGSDTKWIITWVDNSVEGCLGMPIGWYEQRDNFESWRQLECGERYEIKGNVHLVKGEYK